MAKITDFNCENSVKITKGAKLIPKYHQDGCFFRCVLKYDSNNEIKTDTNVSIKVGFNVFADDKLGYSANVWNKAFPTREVKGKTQTVFEWYKSNSDINKNNFWTKYNKATPSFGKTIPMDKGRKVQLAVGYRYLIDATSVSDKNGSYEILNPVWSDVKWLQHDKKSGDGIYQQDNFICGCLSANKLTRIKRAAWCWPGNTNPEKSVETYKNSEEHHFENIPTIPCNYNNNNWNNTLGGFRFAAIELKLMARIQHNSGYYGNPKEDFFYSTSPLTNDLYEKAVRSPKPNSTKEWDVLGTSIIVFDPVDCRKATYGLTGAHADFYYNLPRNSDLKWGDSFGSNENDDGTLCRYGFKLTQPNFDLNREVTYTESNKNHDVISNDDNHYLYFGKFDGKNVNKLPKGKSSYLYNIKDINQYAWRPAQIDCGYDVTYKLKRYGDVYKNLSSKVTYNIKPPNISEKPSVQIKEYIDKTTNEKVRTITYKNVKNEKNIFYIPGILNLKKPEKNEYIYEGNKWKLIREKERNSQIGTYGPTPFSDFSSDRYRFRYGDIFKFNDNHTYYLMYDATDEVIVKIPDPILEVYSTKKDKNKYEILLDENGQKVLRTLIIPFTEVTYIITATNYDLAPYLVPYYLHIKVTNGTTDFTVAEITAIDGVSISSASTKDNKGYFISPSEASTHIITIRYTGYDSNNITLDYFGTNGDDQIDGEIKEDGKPFRTTLFFPDTFKKYNQLENTFSNLKVCYMKGEKQIKLYPYLYKT